MKYLLALDIGGTKITAAAFSQDGSIIGEAVKKATPTYNGNDAVYNAVAETANEILRTNNIKLNQLLGIGVAAPGPLNTKTGVIIRAPLMGWINFNLKERLEQDFHCPAFLDNDCNLGALAEQRVGVAKGKESVFYMTMSTGVGGGFVLNGEIFHGFRDSSCEFGHMNIVENSLTCPCGGVGCLELYASGTGMANRVREDVIKGVKTKILETAEGNPELITAKIITQAAMEGDDYAVSALNRVGYCMGIGLTNIVNLFDPEAIVIGGGFSKAHNLFEKEMFKVMTERAMQPYDPKKMILYSELGDMVVIWGAYIMVSEQIHNS